MEDKDPNISVTSADSSTFLLDSSSRQVKRFTVSPVHGPSALLIPPPLTWKGKQQGLQRESILHHLWDKQPFPSAPSLTTPKSLHPSEVLRKQIRRSESANSLDEGYDTIEARCRHVSEDSCITVQTNDGPPDEDDSLLESADKTCGTGLVGEETLQTGKMWTKAVSDGIITV